MKIYSKKNFSIGLIFLLLALVGIIFTILDFNNLNTLKVLKNILLDICCVIFGIFEVYRSLSKKYTKEDNQDNDEREYLLTMKSKSIAYNITFLICCISTILCIITFAITKNTMLIEIFIVNAAITTIMFLAEICSYLYYNKRN